ncbi:uncharacterized protein LOC132697864 isoform X2 [Cylas formicarius]|uniref:uncharacterized protein LOC132697864 isoform X2 n=1 Tax=Cylas formicarius TaxID=197179 RepID=UPI0029588BEF|nr:uncharacterized protein LOC132697864 isoform X2 [Cylas formicarius]
MHAKRGADDAGPKGPSPDLMPSIMGVFDAYLGETIKETNFDACVKTSTPKRSHQLGNFAHLSPCVQKILSNVPEQEISKKFSSDEVLGPKRLGSNRFAYRSVRSPEKAINKSNENLDIISPNVHKMLSNLPDTELVISTSNLHVSAKNVSRNSSYLYRSRCDLNKPKPVFYHSDAIKRVGCADEGSDKSDCTSDKVTDNNWYGYCKPLGSYLHSSMGIASRTPVGRKNMGKYLQVPSEASGVSAGTNSTASSSEVSRPVSLTSLGSCSSSGSSNGHHQPLAYLASAESLDSDPEPAGSQGSADSGIAEQEQTPITHEQRVLQEVLETETVYVADLNEVIEGYLDPWRGDPECPLAEHLHHLFSNIEEVYEFNRSFLDELRVANCDPTKTANVFLQHDSGFSVYNEYCAHYPRTMEVLGNLQRDEKMAPLFREKQQLLGHALPIGSYLLKPVQRILKYHLLLQRLSKQCEVQHKPAVDLALATMTGIATDINNMKRKHEHAVRVQEIQSQLYGWNGPDLTTFGELIAEGTFRVQGARGRRHVFLFERVLLLAKSKQDGALAYKTHIMCSNLMLVEQVRGEPLSFQVLPFDNPRLQCTLRARSPHHKREWTLQIKRVILENYSAVIPNHARQLVMQLGQDVHDTAEDTSERWSPLKPHSPTPHYLERRCRVRKTRDFSGRRASSQDRSFPSLGSWRRKSEPSMIPQQYNVKTMPKKITKLKKTKEGSSSGGGSSTFYTDLSDSETAAESVERLMTEDVVDEGTANAQAKNGKSIENNLEKIVSELLMQNQEFHKVFNREHVRHPRRNINSEPGPIWYEEPPQLPSKADSLPRSFQLNDQIEDGGGSRNDSMSNGESLKESPEVCVEEQHENDLSSRLDDTDHPEHKIYRKSAIRLSILQRIRMIMSEEQRRNNKYPLRKQGSKSMGEKIAHPDYEDPQKLLLHSRNASSVNLTTVEPDDIMGDRVELDMSFNEKEVLKEIESRLNETPSHAEKPESSLDSSQNSDSYYESILDDSLTEEYVRDSKTGKLVAKQDSFSTKSPKPLNAKRPIIKRPTKAPPPIPAKPQRLSKHGTNETIRAPSCDKDTPQSPNCGAVQTSWVKAMVGRFE